jgi:hypothetical protein
MMSRALTYCLITTEIAGGIVTTTMIGYGVLAGFEPMLIVYAAAGVGLTCASAMLREFIESLSELG